MDQSDPRASGVLDKEETDAKSWTQSLKNSLAGGKSPPSAKMPVERDAERYNMSHSKRGKAVIFNHKKFNNGMASRSGTDRDEEHLKACFAILGFEVIVHKDLKRLEIFKVLEDLQKEDHSDKDCLVIAVMSHGEHEKIHSLDSHYRPEDLWDPFTADACPTLAGKPKLFFIQACRGDQLDGGVRLARTQTDSRASDQEKNFYVIPNRADFLVCYSTVPGYYSWRNTNEGSWFIQTLTKVLAAYKNTKDLLSMMTIVTRRVALDFESNVPSNSMMDQKKQVPMISSTLTRDLFFWN